MYDLQNAEDFSSPFTHEEMLSSSERLEKYYEGIKRTVKKGDVVVDIGAGTGILSFFAARFAEKVYAVEHSRIIEKAIKVCADNKINNVQFVQCNSRDFKLEEKADLIVHEQIGGANPFSENMVANLIDARRRILKPGGRILPNKIEVFLEPVQLKAPYRIPFLWEFDIKSISFRSLRPEQQNLPARGNLITPYHCRQLPAVAFECFLCRPKPIMQFDLETLNEGDLPRLVHYENTAIRDGIVDGLWIYFKAAFDDEISIDTSPDGPSPSNSWVQMIYRIEMDRVKQGDVVKYDLEIDSILDDSCWALTWHGSQNRT
jgi:protein arginine N-methyltransferase 1